MTAFIIITRLDSKAPQVRGTFFRLFRLEVSEVYKRVGNSWSEMYKGVMKNFYL